MIDIKKEAEAIYLAISHGEDPDPRNIILLCTRYGNEKLEEAAKVCDEIAATRRTHPIMEVSAANPNRTEGESMPALTPEQIASLVELYERTTPGPFFSEDISTQCESAWYVRRSETLEAVADFVKEADADFWITARSVMPALIETLAERDAEVKYWKGLTVLEFEKVDALRTELQQANDRIAELEREQNYKMSNDEANRIAMHEAGQPK